MKRIDQIAKGLEILSRHDENGLGVCAEHDVIYAGPGLHPATIRDTAKELEALGWDWDDSLDTWHFFV